VQLAAETRSRSAVTPPQVLMQLWMLSSFLLDSLAVGGQTLIAVQLASQRPHAAREIGDRLLEVRAFCFVSNVHLYFFPIKCHAGRGFLELCLHARSASPCFLPVRHTLSSGFQETRALHTAAWAGDWGRAWQQCTVLAAPWLLPLLKACSNVVSSNDC